MIAPSAEHEDVSHEHVYEGLNFGRIAEHIEHDFDTLMAMPTRDNSVPLMVDYWATRTVKNGDVIKDKPSEQV